VETVSGLSSGGAPGDPDRRSNQTRPVWIRVKAPLGVKLMPHRHPEDRIYTVASQGRLTPLFSQPLTCCMSLVQQSMIGRTLSHLSGGNIGTTRRRRAGGGPRRGLNGRTKPSQQRISANSVIVEREAAIWRLRNVWRTFSDRLRCSLLHGPHSLADELGLGFGDLRGRNTSHARP
jgi:hypothetical protein